MKVANSNHEEHGQPPSSDIATEAQNNIEESCGVDDDIGGGMNELDEEDGEFNEEETRATLVYLETQFASLQTKREQLENVIAPLRDEVGSEDSEQIVKMQ